MAALVQHIELSKGIPDVTVPEGYSGIAALVTLHGAPLGDISLDTGPGVISSAIIADEVNANFLDKIQWLNAEHESSSSNSPYRTSALPRVDVIICTSGHRPQDLEKAIRSVSEATYPAKSIIVVDNGAQCDQTRGIALSYGAKYVKEELRGLDFARNKGIAVSQADYVVFVDDDVRVDPLWLESIVKAFELDPAIACVTGLTMPMELETDAQVLFERYCEGGMRRGYQRRVFDRFNLPPVAAGRVGAGANMAFRRVVLKELGGFDEAFDCGTPARAGGDADMFYRVIRSGFKICYEPRALAWHRHRTNMNDLAKQLEGYSIAVYAFFVKCVLEYKDLSAVRAGFIWFTQHHLRNIVLSLTGKCPMPRDIVKAEVLGVFKGIPAYFQARTYASDARFQLSGVRR